ncbi:MAG: CDP-alcohol phosphatidyltransferase family protein [Spirochaetota bacterium]|nr:CDP-alcohol phosphatidyltransferase family protein [Spirochaetota bacterium]
MIDSHLQHHIKNILKNKVKLLTSIGVTANQITILGLCLGLGVAFAILNNNNTLAIILLLLSGYCDILDGLLARAQGGGSSLGTLMDITFDRLVEVSIVLALGFTYPNGMPVMMLLLASIVICISVFLVVGIIIQKESYKSFFYAPGLMERTEAFILFLLLIVFPQWIIIIGTIGSLLIFATGVQRFILTIKYLD